MSKGRARAKTAGRLERPRSLEGAADKPPGSSRRRPSADLLVLAGIVLVGLGLRAAYLRELVHRPDFSAPTIDAGFHDYWARGLAAGDWAPPAGRGDPRVATTPYLRPPGYPWFLALIYRVAGTGYVAPRIVQMCLGLVSSVLAFLIGRRWFGPGVGLVWSGFMSVYWAFIYFEGEFHAPAVLIPLLLGVVGLLGLWAASMAPRHCLAAGLLLGLSALVRPNALLFMPVVILWACWVAYRRGEWRPFFLAAGGFIAAVVVVVAPATIRNYRVASDFVLISSNAGINLYIGNNEHADGRVADDLPGFGQFATCYDYPALVGNLEKKLGRSLKHSEVSAHFVGQAWAFVRSHPLDFLKLTARKAWLFWGPNEIAHNKAVACERRFSPVLGRIPGDFASVLALGLVGVAMLVGRWKGQRARSGPPNGFRRETREVSLLVLLLVLTYFVSVLPFFVSARYRVPIIPFLLLFGAYGVCGVVRLARAGAFKKAGVWIVMGVGLYLLADAASAESPRDLAKWHCDRGLALYHQGQVDGAVVEYREALRVSPGYKIAQINLAAALGEQGDLEEAIARAAEAVRRNPNVAAPHNNLALTLSSAGRTAEAVEHYAKAVELQPDLVEVRFNVAALLLKMGRIDEAVIHLSEAVRLRPDSADAHLQLGDALRRRGRLDEAEEHHGRAVALDPDHLPARLSYAALLAGRGKTEQAVEAYREALRIDPNSARAHNGLGTMKLRAGRWSEAEAHYRTAVRLDPNLATAHSNLGLALAKQQKLAEAVAEYRRALRLDPTQVKVQIALGNALRALGNRREAAEVYRRAVEVGPDDAEARFLLGLALHDQGELDAAIAEYRQVLRINPSHRQAQQALELALVTKGQE